MFSSRSRGTLGQRGARRTAEGSGTRLGSSVAASPALPAPPLTAASPSALSHSSPTSSSCSLFASPSISAQASEEGAQQTPQREAAPLAPHPQTARPSGSREISPHPFSLSTARKRSASGSTASPQPVASSLPPKQTTPDPGLAPRAAPAPAPAMRQTFRSDKPPSSFRSTMEFVKSEVALAATPPPVDRCDRNRIDCTVHPMAGNSLAPGRLAAEAPRPPVAGTRNRSSSRSSGPSPLGAAPITISGRTHRAYPSSATGTHVADAESFMPGSFTRSRMSMGDDDDDEDEDDEEGEEDEEEMDTDTESTDAAWISSRSMASSTSTRPSSTQGDEPFWESRKASNPDALAASSRRWSAARQPTPLESRHPHGDVSIQSQETDWDEELGITEMRQGAGSLLRPLPFASSLLLHAAPSKPTDHSPVASCQIHQQQRPELESPVGFYDKSPQIRGLRITQSVSESWDDDFLFQNDETDTLDSEPTPSAFMGRRSSIRSRTVGSARVFGSGETPAAAVGRKAMGSPSDGDAGSDDDENWDAAFSWDDKQQRQLSLRKSASPREVALRPSLGIASHGLPAMSSSTLAFQALHSARIALQNVPASSNVASPDAVMLQRGLAHARADSTSSRGSAATDLSVLMAAQSDMSSWRTRSSTESCETDLVLGDGRTVPGKLEPLAIARGGRSRETSEVTVLDTSLEDSGEETETEADVCLTPISPKAAKDKKGKRRSLLASFTRNRDGRDSPSANQVDDGAWTRAKRDSRQTSGRLLGLAVTAESSGSSPSMARSKNLFYKVDAYSASRTSIVNPPNTSVQVAGRLRSISNDPPHDELVITNPSLTSLGSLSSQRSRRSSGGPSKLEKACRALLQTKMGRQLSPKGHQTALATSPSPPTSPPGRYRALSHEAALLEQNSGAAGPVQAPAPELSATAMPPTDATRHKAKASLSSNFGFAAPPRSSAMAKLISVGEDVQPSLSKVSASTRVLSKAGEGERPLQSRRARSSSGVEDEPLSFYNAGTQLRTVANPSSPVASPTRSRRDNSSSATLRASAGGSRTLRRGLTGPASDSTITLNQPTVGAASSAYAGPADTRPALAREASSRKNSADRCSAVPPPSANSRSVSASTAASACSSSMLSQSQCKDGNWSGTEMYDSETTHGTSVGSDSPPASRLSESLHVHAKGRKPSGPESMAVSKSVSSRGLPSAGLKRLDSRRSVPAPPASSQPHLFSMLQGSDDPPSEFFEAGPSPDGGRATRGAAEPSSALADDASSVGGAALSTAPSAPAATISDDKVKETAKRPIGRRNSLSDLRIPSRISKAQTGIRANITLVRDFAKGVEELKALQARHDHLRSLLDTGKDAPGDQVQELEQRFQAWWDCADVLVGLGQGRGEADAQADVRTVSQSPVGASVAAASGHSARERRITLDAPGSRRTSVVSQAPRLDSATAHQLPSAKSTSTLAGVAGRKERQAEGLKSRTSSTSSRNVNPQREIDIIAVMLNASSIAPDSPPPTIWERAGQKPGAATTDDRANGSTDHLAIAPQDGRQGLPEHEAEMAATRPSTGSLSFVDASLPPREVERPHGRPSAAYPYHTAPAAAGSRVSLFGAVSSDSIGITDGTKSAKRRLRSASRAGLQGLKELLRAFRTNGNEDEASDKAGAADGQLVKNAMPPRKSVDGLGDAANKEVAEASTGGGDKKSATPNACKRSSFGWNECRAEKSAPKFDRWKVAQTSPERRRSHMFRRIKEGEPPSPRLPPSSPPLSPGSPLAKHHASGPSSPVMDNHGVESRPSTTSQSRPATAGSSGTGRRGVSRTSGQLDAQGPSLPPKRVSSSGHGKAGGAIVAGGPTERSSHIDERASPTWSTAADAGREDRDVPAQPSTSGADGTPIVAASHTLRPSRTQRSQIGRGHPSKPATKALPRSLSLSRSPSPPRPGSSQDRSGAASQKPSDGQPATASPGKTVDSRASARLSMLASTDSDMSSSGDRPDVPGLSTPSTSFQKMALRPEAIPSLLVYLHATRQHCQEALEGLQNALERLEARSDADPR